MRTSGANTHSTMKVKKILRKTKRKTKKRRKNRKRRRTKRKKRMRMEMTKRRMKKKTTMTKIRMKTMAMAMVMMKRKTKIPMKTKMIRTIKLTKTTRMSKIKTKLMMMVNKTGKMKMIHNQWLTALRHLMTSMRLCYVYTIKRELSTLILIDSSLTLTLLLKHSNGLCIWQRSVSSSTLIGKIESVKVRT